jgi:LCP family protein required for cell wall assembly
MSRMDRNKELHEKLAKEEQRANRKETIFARRETKASKKPNNPKTFSQNDFEEQEYYTDYQEQPRSGANQYTNQNSIQRPKVVKGKNKGKQPAKKQSKPKKVKRKRSFLRVIIYLLIFLFAYSIVSFVAGQQVAKNDADAPEAETFNGVASANGAKNILLLGSDSRKGETGRADTIMVLQLDGPSKKPKLLSFMRDTLVTIPGYGENKINAAYAFGGAELVRQTLAQNFGIETNYYAKVDFKSFEKVIDTLFPSGVAINAEKDMSTNLEVPIKKGQQNMNGLELLQYARFRMDEEGDFGRVRRQQQVMDAVFSAMKNPLSIAKLPYAAGKVLGYASTNLPVSYLLKNTFSIAKGAGGIDRLTVPVNNSWQYGSTYEAGSVLVINFDTNKQAIENFLSQ